MNGEPDVIVLGAGVAGLGAALAARAAGAEVLVVHGGAGASALSSGAWDVAPPLHAEELRAPTHTVAERVRALVRARPYHPYAALDDALAAIGEAHALVLPALGIYRPLDLNGHGVLAATDLGLLRRPATAQTHVLDLAESPEGAPVGVADLGGYPAWDAAFLAASLTEVGHDTRRFSPLGAPVFDPGADAVRHPHELAAVADGDEGRSRLGAALAAAARDGGVRAVLVPPVLGLASDEAVSAVRRAAGVAVGEALAALAGPQGLRLDRRIHAALEAAGVDVRYAPAAAVRVDGRTVRVEIAGDASVVAGAVVLATGKHVGGGLAVRGGVTVEPVAGLPVRTHGRLGPLPSSPHGPDPVEHFGRDWWEGGPGFSQGVGFDRSFRALGPGGDPAAPGLFVAGALLDGVDPARDGTGLGCCATTGHQAGKSAAHHAAK